MYLEQLRVAISAGVMHVERLGRGLQVILFVHGFGTNASLWRPVAAQLANEGVLVLSPDLLGHGDSDRPLDASYDLGSHADALDEVMTALRVRSAIVVGQDVGALVALALAARHGDRVEQLVLLNPPDLNELPPAPVREMQRVAARVMLSGSGDALSAAPVLESLLRDALGGGAALDTAAMARYLASWSWPGSVEQLQRLARALEDDGVPLAALAAVDTSTLIVRGDADKSVSPTVSLELARALPHAEHETWQRVGRLVAEDAPARLVSALSERIGTVDSATSLRQ